MRPSHDILARLARTPLLQAPMAGVSTPALAAAVSEAGALGAIAIGAVGVEQARQMVRDTAALTAEPFHVNVFCHQPVRPDPARDAAWLARLAPLFAEFGGEPPQGLREIYRSFLDGDAVLRMLLEERPAVVSFHFGLPPAAWIQALRGAGIFTLASATNPDEARTVEDAGVQAIVAQGVEAGGHRGLFDPDAGDPGLSTAVLVRLLARSTRLPLIAAGGIMDGAGIRAVRDLGALAAQLGTAFVLCPESAAAPAYRAMLQGPRARDTRITAAISGRPARGIANRWRELEGVGAPPAAYPSAYDAGKQLHELASRAGSPEFGAFWAGQGAPLARALPAAELVATLLAELRGA